MDQFVWTVYKTTCSVNTHFYFGIHKTKEPNDGYLGSGTVLRRAVKKHGRNRFTKEVLFVFNTKEEANFKEIELIGRELNNPTCYNIAKGGEAGWEYVNRSGTVSRHWRDNRDSRRKAISEAVRKKWADPEHHRTHAAANRCPKARARQSRGHIRQWSKFTEAELLEIGRRRSARWGATTPEQKAQFKAKISSIRRQKLGINRSAVMEFTKQHQELTYAEIGVHFSISGVTVQRIYHQEFGFSRTSGTMSGKHHCTPALKNKLQELGKARYATLESRWRHSQLLKGIPKPKVICDKCGRLVGSALLESHQTGKFSCIRRNNNRKTVCVCGLTVSAASLRRHQRRKKCK